MNFLQQAIISHLPAGTRQTPSGWRTLNCPMCIHNGEPSPDKRGRGGIKIDNDGSFAFNCFRCGYATRWEEGRAINQRLTKLMFELNFSLEEVRRLKFEALRKKTSYVKIEPPKVESFEGLSFEERGLPMKARPITEWASQKSPLMDFLKAIEYLGSRGQHILNGWSYYWSPKMVDRIIIPFFWEDKIVGWTARYIGDEKGTTRYLSEQAPHYLFNNKVITIPRRKYIILVEGSFDAVAIEGVGALGNTLTEEQIDWLKSSEKEVIVLPDLQPSKRSLADIALEEGWPVSFPDWEKDVKDAAKAVQRYGKVYTLKSILDSRIYNKVKIGMMIKKCLR